MVATKKVAIRIYVRGNGRTFIQKNQQIQKKPVLQEMKDKKAISLSETNGKMTEITPSYQ